MNKANVRELLHKSDFKHLFLDELGWDNHDGTLSLKVGEDTVVLGSVAEKRGMGAYLCPMPGHGKSYDYPTRCRIETQLAKSVREHLIIYADSDRQLQIWQWVKREPGKPIARREHSYHTSQPGDSLIQKLGNIEVKIEEEDSFTLLDVTSRAKRAFDVDKITKRFYDRYKAEHAAFLKQIDGIGDKDDCEWYASVILNRLKFVYFIQKKGFLDKDSDYLRHRLETIQKNRSKTKFLSFYRAFLIKLFHDGLGKKERTPELQALLGTIPYLNGGIFAVHPLEEKYAEIDIADKAFEKVFAFFDQYRWHLDERPLRDDNEINPDVLGYIFEKYINQKQMGAYYTKEDITEYISKNCVVPFIFDQVRAELEKKKMLPAYERLFDCLKVSLDRYIYDVVRHGLTVDIHEDPPRPLEAPLPLASSIEKGIKDMSKRVGWNKPAPVEVALPTETWREVVARRRRYEDTRSLMAKGEVCGINDFITLNLNIRQFAQDCIENCDDPHLLVAFWKAIENITVLDPTCGSGAFLFAALNVLEPLYEACLDRMKAFMLEWSQQDRVPHPNYYKDFAAVIARVEKHPNEKYFIYKSIIIRNLYGVDIMDEAVEICKLRLFLKLAAQIEPDYDDDNLGIEPLPDIDFNIRAGNTIVGFAAEKQVEDVLRQDLLAYSTVWPEVQRDAKEIAELFGLFRQQQTEIGGAVSAKDKARLRAKLAPLEDRLNAYLAETYGVTKRSAISDWVRSHKPFHWFIEFYEIMAKGGFSSIIGNPPYVEYTEKNVPYRIGTLATANAGNLYAFIMERSINVLAPRGRIGLIVPAGSVSSERMSSLQSLLLSQFSSCHLSHYSAHGCPAVLFEGAFLRLTIIEGCRNDGTSTEPTLYSAKYMKWYRGERNSLFQRLGYQLIPGSLRRGPIPRIENGLALSIRAKMSRNRPLANSLIPNKHSAPAHYYNAPLHWMKAFTFLPRSWNERDGVIHGSHYKPIACHTREDLQAVVATLNSSLFYWHFIVQTNCRDLQLHDIENLPFNPTELAAETKGSLVRLCALLMKDYKDKATLKVRMQETTGRMELQEIDPRKSKAIIDEIDRVLAKHYGFTDEELDFIINYDIKYRMGQDAGDAEEE